MPGNGKLISIWTESILEKPPLETLDELRPLKDWFAETGLEKLSDISEWG